VSDQRRGQEQRQPGEHIGDLPEHPAVSKQDQTHPSQQVHRLQRAELAHHPGLDNDPADEQQPDQGQRIRGAAMPPRGHRCDDGRGNRDHAGQGDAAEHRAVQRQPRS
jgi:hypothetical protein